MRSGLGLVVLLLVMAGTAVGAEKPMAVVAMEAGQVSFTPVETGYGLHLTVSGPQEIYVQKSFKPGEKASFSAADTAGKRLADGVYTYELRVQPVVTPDVRKVLLTARESGERSALAELQAAGKLPAETLVQSGAFSVIDGDLVEPKKPETITKDEVVIDDMIVDGSLCAGEDCYENIAFGYDTVLLPENNLRMFFDDTSNISGFPNNDWRILINDTYNGGANYFAIQDATEVSTPFLIEAGAPDSSLYVADSGLVGIGTATPLVDLHISCGDTPKIRLEQTSELGFTGQKWDVGGNEGSFFIRDATSFGKLPFRIDPGALSNSIYIKADGSVAMGTWNAEAELEIEREGDVRIRLDDTDTGGAAWVIQSQNGNLDITKAGTGVKELSLDGDGNLVIRGTLMVREGFANETTYPDYVFAPDYELMPLAELGRYVTENRHLPRIPPARTLARGLNMTEMQVKLLEKVEELTLYTIEQQEIIEQLTGRTTDQLATIEALTRSSSEQQQVIDQLMTRLAALEQASR